MKLPTRKLLRKKLNANEQRVVDDVREFGCHVSFIFDPDGVVPNFCYSIGFPQSVAQPEVIVFGLRQELMHSMVNEVHRQCADGLRLSDGLRIGGLLEGYDCILRHVVDPVAIEEHLGWAIWYHRSQRKIELTEAFQIVWPGTQQGKFPWEVGCDPDVIAIQPAIYQSRLHS